MRTPRKCIGFGEFEGKCDQVAGCFFTPYWCSRCNKLRMDHIDKQLGSMIADMERKSLREAGRKKK